MIEHCKIKTMLRSKWFAVSCILIIVVGLLEPQYIKTFLPNGGTIKISAGSCLGSLLESTCRIEIKTSSGQMAHVEVLRHAFLDMPLIVIPSTNDDMFFCIYAQDPYYVAMRIRTGQPFQKIPRESPIKGTVVSSNCRIERVLGKESGDWMFIASQLKNMPSRQYKSESVAAISLFGLSLHYNRKLLIASMRNRGDTGPFEDDSL